jgi:hypothetical protein
MLPLSDDHLLLEDHGLIGDDPADPGRRLDSRAVGGQWSRSNCRHHAPATAPTSGAFQTNYPQAFGHVGPSASGVKPSRLLRERAAS